MRKFFRRISIGLKNLWAWVPVIWNDRQWDWDFIMKIEKKKLDCMIKWYTKEVENPNAFNSINIGDVLNELKLARRLIDLIEDDGDKYITYTGENKTEKQENGLYRVVDTQTLHFNHYVNKQNFKRFMPNFVENDMEEFGDIFDLMLYREKLWHLYFKYKMHKMPGWWD